MAATEVIWFPFRTQPVDTARLNVFLGLSHLFDHLTPGTCNRLVWSSLTSYFHLREATYARQSVRTGYALVLREERSYEKAHLYETTLLVNLGADRAVNGLER